MDREQSQTMQVAKLGYGFEQSMTELGSMFDLGFFAFSEL